jgi:hypothetical protein
VVQQLHTTCNIQEGTDGHKNKQKNGTMDKENENNIEMHGEANNKGPKGNLQKDDGNERREEVQPPETVMRET